MSPSVKPEKWQDMNIKAIAHGFVLLIINLKKLHIWVHLCQLTYLHKAIPIQICLELPKQEIPLSHKSKQK